MATDFLAKWSAQEEELFALGRMLYGKDLRAVATLLPNKTPAELVEYYYLRKRPAPPPPSSARRAAKEEEEVEVELPREANCTKCGHHRVVARRCTAAGCTTAVCGRCIYNPALVPKGHTESVKNAWWRCDACVTTLCEATPKGSAVNVDGVSRLVSLGCEAPLLLAVELHITPLSLSHGPTQHS